MKTVHVLPFGQLLRYMMTIRNTNARALAKKAGIPDEAISMLCNGLFQPTPECESLIRPLLDWPKGSDDLLSIVVSSKYEDTPTIPTEEPEAEAPNPEPPSAPRITSEQADTLKRKVGRPRSTRGFDEERPINLSNLHGRVLG
jgi:hypothetical protein